jgi:hypothetical protein
MGDAGGDDEQGREVPDQPRTVGNDFSYRRVEDHHRNRIGFVIFGDMFCPSDIWAGGNSRKSMLTLGLSMLVTR